MPVDLKLLEKSPTFHALTPEQCVALAGQLKYEHFPIGEPICELGKPGDTMYFIEKGEVVFYTHDAGGEEKIFRTLGVGEFFGEVAILSRGVRSVNAKAQTEVFAWELHEKDFKGFVAAHPDIAVTIMKGMAHRLETSAAMLEHTVTPGIAKTIDASRTDTEKRVEWLVQRFGGITALIANGVGCLLWIGVNLLRPKEDRWDSHEFGFLALFLAFEALIVTILVLAKQNRDEKDADIRNDTMMEKVQITPVEVMHLREQVKVLAELIHAERHDRQHPPR
ncbi:MAG: rane protein [Chthonomonadales bacterium]|nr:rane protein [Chthonomonadales bacterium]